MSRKLKKDDLLWSSPIRRMSLGMLVYTMMAPLGVVMVLKSGDSWMVKSAFSIFFLVWFVREGHFLYKLYRRIGIKNNWFFIVILFTPPTSFYVFSESEKGFGFFFMFLVVSAVYIYSKILYSANKELIIDLMVGDMRLPAGK